MSMNLTMLVVHVLVALAFALLFKRTPDLLQRVVIGLLIAASIVMVYAYSTGMSGLSDQADAMRWIAQEIEHVGIVLYAFRLYYIDNICKRFSPPSQHLQR